jgi:hypothetical protein
MKVLYHLRSILIDEKLSGDWAETGYTPALLIHPNGTSIGLNVHERDRGTKHFSTECGVHGISL